MSAAGQKLSKCIAGFFTLFLCVWKVHKLGLYGGGWAVDRGEECRGEEDCFPAYPFIPIDYLEHSSNFDPFDFCIVLF